MTRRRARGLTVVELIIAVVILAIMAAVAMPMLSNALAQRRLIGAATRVASDLRYAQAQAVTQGNLHRIRFDGSGQYLLERSTNGGTTWTAMTQWYAISSEYSGASITSVQDSGGLAASEVRFNPQGGAANPGAVSYPIRITVTAQAGTQRVDVQRSGSVKLQ